MSTTPASSTTTPLTPSPSSFGLTLMIDNYDSFTYNIVQYLSQLGAHVVVHRNDDISVAQALALNPSHVVISPGPGNPSEAGVSKDIIAAFAGKVPVLGVCLGHQSIIEVYGGDVVRCGHIMHGKVSPVYHDGKGVYAGLGEEKTPPSPPSYPAPPPPAFTSSLLATRYHSLVGEPRTLPTELMVTSYVVEAEKAGALTSEEKAKGKGEVEEKEDAGQKRQGRTIMGVRHVRYTVEGVQFHPESVTTEHGMTMFNNFLRLRGGEWKDATLL